MLAKEVLDARWKLGIGALVSIAFAVLLAATYNLVKGALSPAVTQTIPPALRGQVTSVVSSYSLYVWSQWFPKNGTDILAILAAILGGGLIAGEVSKGTIFFILSRPISRERLLLTKYGVGVAVLLIVTVLASAALLIVSAIEGHPQGLSQVLIATLLLWLGALFVLGIATLFSVIFADILRPVVLALVVTVVVSIPGFFPNSSAWSLTSYWSSQSAYLSGGFPVKAFIICLIAAVFPLLIAIPLFRRRAY